MYRQRRSFIRTLFTVFLTSVGIGVAIFILTSGYITRNIAPLPTPQIKTEDTAPKPQQLAYETQNVNQANTVDIIKNAVNGVVGISVLKVDKASIFDSNSAEKWGVGSGIIVSENGYILTNNHVAGGNNKRIVVSLPDGKNIEGTTVWSEPVLDLAVVKIDKNGLNALVIGDSNKLQVGEQAIAIGNPMGLEFQRTVTSGIVSALNRTIKIETEEGTNYMEDLIQTDASINPGNSGGPLINSKGEVIGINTIKVASAEAIGFAVPINVVVPIIKQFQEKGIFQETYLGIFAYDKHVMSYVDENLKIDNGIYVATVDESTPAFKAGIKEGCIITKVDDNEINTMMQLRTYLYTKKPGDVVNVTHFKDGSFETIPIKLISKDKEWSITR